METLVDDFTQTLGAGPLLGIAAGAIALILVLVIKFKVHAFLTLVLVSLVTAFATGLPPSALVSTLVGSFGTTLGSVALLIGLGAMLGKMVEHSGGARVLADKLVEVFGEKRAPFALGLASLIMGFPIFFDAGLIVMLPIIFAVARRMGGTNVLLYGIPAAAAFSVMHVFVPPHPGPVAATELYGRQHRAGAARRHRHRLPALVRRRLPVGQVRRPPGTSCRCRRCSARSTTTSRRTRRRCPPSRRCCCFRCCSSS